MENSLVAEATLVACFCNYKTRHFFTHFVHLSAFKNAPFWFKNTSSFRARTIPVISLKTTPKKTYIGKLLCSNDRLCMTN